MEIRHLRCFLAVADELHFGRAAARLHMTQPPLSQQVRSLERELGTRLFERSSRRVALTAAGEALLAPARRILDEEAVASRVVDAARVGQVGRVRIGFAGTTAYGVLPTLRRRVAREFPGIEMVLHSQVYSEAAAGLVQDGELEFGFVSLPVRPALDWLPLTVERLVCALPAGHRLSEADHVDITELAAEEFVAFPHARGSAVRDLVMRACHDAGFTPDVVQESPDPFSLLTMVAADVGVALVLESAGRVQLDQVVIRPLRDDVQLAVGLAWSRPAVSPAVLTVLDVARRTFPVAAGTP
ncbi:LysR family transcriptional regulator [Modestobacter sp. I12A-02628]|uniref:LysR family transcriptional regulator n=1 Tax=Goekera deserti TaxID=2497753 RepID=A0A7K3WB88_9ACTN|nr:LysR substrate-binding domain-containing protein [Goekera deserti]MPQ97412.1 LysR family transcriptional regulator [Goekera deserti]NDI47987.1 LysR family transcriptional regulator [Goekera deserti]NEL53735.1 LysR family transcriptional regulator [Goekera deserti]